MATCVAKSTDEQFWCDFFSGSSRDMKKCMFKDGAIDDHCGSFEAEDFSKEHGVVRRGEESPVETYVAPEVVAPTKAPSASAAGVGRKTCIACSNFTGCPLMTIEAMTLGKAVKSLTDQDFWTIGSRCVQHTIQTLASI
jgi:hypothetical protein